MAIKDMVDGRATDIAASYAALEAHRQGLEDLLNGYVAVDQITVNAIKIGRVRIESGRIWLIGSGATKGGWLRRGSRAMAYAPSVKLMTEAEYRGRK